MVEVPRYSALEGIDNLEDTEAAVRIQSRNLEVDHPGAEHLAPPLKSICTGWDVNPTYLRGFFCHERPFLTRVA